MIQRAILWLAAAYNLVIGAAALFAPAEHVEARVVGLLVLCFGVVYALVASDIARFRPVLWAGVIGKAGVVVLMAPLVQAGLLPGYVGVILTGDALFMAAFVWILLRREGSG
ncbi:hypothetical protein [Parerythrobacter lacustris]|uniref:Uncharacterized protein n=1 Tax=Parerythrobacter lacustris TaxID=2969984 RepID=A0ABT1XR19_9SPHN|nr:hypothetical protein [Parerythrobacter lacustris]MCR2832892.1 hypothetical protein [Parerythrobacter lacustris]